MKIAVTGATGGLGRSLTEFLLERGAEVVALGRNQAIGGQLQAIGARFVPCDIQDIASLNKAFSGVDQVVHSAGLASPWGDWETFNQANVLGTQAVIDSVLHSKVSRLIHISSPSIYFSRKPAEQIREDSALPPPANFYARSKKMSEDLVTRASARHGLDAVILRPRSIFGKYDAAIVPRIVRVMKKGSFPLPGGGRARVDVTAVQNVAHAIWLCANYKTNLKGEAYNITNGEPMTVKELTAMIAESLELKPRFIPLPLGLLNAAAVLLESHSSVISRKEPIFTRYSIQSMGITQTLSIEKAQSLLGYAPVLSIREALALMR